jgi:FKBP-type peptidyl-prolyl cis-trans isomerase FkpA
MKFFYILLSVAVLTACGGDKEAEEKVNLDSAKDQLSYCLGAEQAKMITESGDPNLNKLDFDAIVEGFSEGLNSKEPFDEACRASLMKLYGPYGQDFDTSEVKTGSKCIGRISGSVFFNGWFKKGGINQINLETAKIGFRHGLNKKDTLVPMATRTQMVADFMGTLNRKIGEDMMANAKKLPNTKVLEGGIVIETIQDGNGGSPNENDDVEADYVLTNAIGDTIESSFEYRKRSGGEQIPVFNLKGVIPGWTAGFPNLKKGGKYRMYIPWNLAYGEKGGYESLCFYIEFKNYGPAGTLVKPREEMIGQ